MWMKSWSPNIYVARQWIDGVVHAMILIRDLAGRIPTNVDVEERSFFFRTLTPTEEIGIWNLKIL